MTPRTKPAETTLVQEDFFIPPATTEYAERLKYLPHGSIRPDPEQPRNPAPRGATGGR